MSDGNLVVRLSQPRPRSIPDHRRFQQLDTGQLGDSTDNKQEIF